MSNIALSSNNSGNGTFTIASLGTNTDRTLTLPDATGTINVSGLANEVPAGSNTAPAIYPTGDTNTGVFFPAADTVAVATGGIERMRIDSAGNAGIGTNSPANFAGAAVKLVVGSATTTTTPGAVTVYSGTATYGGLYFADGTVGDQLYRGAIEYNHSTDALLLYSAGAERARIDASGTLLVGTTSTPSGGSGGTALSAESFGRRVLYMSSQTTAASPLAYFFNPNGLVGYITCSGSTTSYVTSSDYRLKENIEPMQNALDIVAQLNPVTYTWKADGSAGQGFIAHELQAIVPDCVTGEKDAIDEDGNPEYQGIDTSFLVATLVKAIQEQQATIEALTSRIETLEAK